MLTRDGNRFNRPRLTVKVAIVATIVVTVLLVALILHLRKRELYQARVATFQNCLWTLLLSEGNEILPDADIQDAAGKPIASWRQYRYISRMPVPENSGPSDLPWTDPSYSRLRSMPAELLCYAGTTYTSVMAVVGEGCAFNASGGRVEQLPADCLLLLEVNQNQVHWMQPGDLNVADLVPDRDVRVRPSSNLGGAFCVGFADGEVWLVRSDVPLSRLRRLAVVEDARMTSRDAELGEYLLIRRESPR